MKKLRRTILIWTVVITMAALGNEAGKYFVNAAPEVKTRKIAALSVDQRELVQEVGYPDTFTIVFSAAKGKSLREETWNYYDLSTAFAFRNGKYAAGDTLAQVPPDDTFMPQVKPSSFTPSMSLADISSLIEEKPFRSRKLSHELLPGATIYGYPSGLYVGEIDGKIAYVQSVPVAAKGPK